MPEKSGYTAVFGQRTTCFPAAMELSRDKPFIIMVVHLLLRLCFYGLFLVCWSTVCPVAALAADPEACKWTVLEPGMELAVLHPVPTTNPPLEVVVLRMDPQAVDFVLLNASETGTAASLDGWADRNDLVAAINASMYLPDARTSTGYMRNGSHVNNPRIVNKFGAFFVAGRHPGITQFPRAGILDRTVDQWKQCLPLYDIVVQNYRLIGAEGRVLWTPGGPSYAVSAIGQDTAGNILFLHCREPITGEAFGRLLLQLPLHLRVVMYVEGGPQAGLLVRAGAVNNVWMGRHFADFWTSGNKQAPLPNVIGVKRRTDLSSEAKGITSTAPTPAPHDDSSPARQEAPHD